jgi:hypothetical protein
MAFLVLICYFMLLFSICLTENVIVIYNEKVNFLFLCIHILNEGGTGRKIVKNFESIVNAGLPMEKLRLSFEDPEVAKDTILDYITF